MQGEHRICPNSWCIRFMWGDPPREAERLLRELTKDHSLTKHQQLILELYRLVGYLEAWCKWAWPNGTLIYTQVLWHLKLFTVWALVFIICPVRGEIVFHIAACKCWFQHLLREQSGQLFWLETVVLLKVITVFMIKCCRYYIKCIPILLYWAMV